MATRSETSPKNGQSGGRPKGRKNNKTLERELALERIRERVFGATDVLIDGQLTNARGVSYLFRIDTEEDAKGNRRKSKPVLVTSVDEIENYLAGEYDGDPDSYYYITTEKPETQAAKELWDRALGKAPQAITGPDGGVLKIAFDPSFKNESN